MSTCTSKLDIAPWIRNNDTVKFYVCLSLCFYDVVEWCFVSWLICWCCTVYKRAIRCTSIKTFPISHSQKSLLKGNIVNIWLVPNTVCSLLLVALIGIDLVEMNNVISLLSPWTGFSRTFKSVHRLHCFYLLLKLLHW